MPTYDVFISYSHAKDKPIASALAGERRGQMKFSTLAALAIVASVGTATHTGCATSMWPTVEHPMLTQQATEVTLLMTVDDNPSTMYGGGGEGAGGSFLDFGPEYWPPSWDI
jgi:hypothetical protein